MTSRFLNALRTEQVSDEGAGKYRLVLPLLYRSKLLGRVVEVPDGFRTDFASVPRLPLAFMLAGDTAQRPAVVHDFLYACKDVERATADAVFLEAMEVIGVPWWRRRMMWLAVRTFGGFVRKTSVAYKLSPACGKG